MECGSPPPGGLDLGAPPVTGASGTSGPLPAAPTGPAPDPQWTPPPGWVPPSDWNPPAAAPPTAGPVAPSRPDGPIVEPVPADEAAWPYPTAPPLLVPPSGYTPTPTPPPAPAEPLLVPPSGYTPTPPQPSPLPPSYPPPPPPPGYAPGYAPGPPPSATPGQWGGLPYTSTTPDYAYVPTTASRYSPRHLAIAGAAAAAVVALAIVAFVVVGSKKTTTHHPTVPTNVASQQVASVLLGTVPTGYVAALPGVAATGALDIAGAAKLEQDPANATRVLTNDAFEGGYARGWNRQAKPGVIVAVGYQFASPGDAKKYYDLYLVAQRNKAGTTEFGVTDITLADGFTDATDKAVTLQTVVLLRGKRVFVIGIGDPSGGATPSDATALARTQAKLG